MLGDGRGAGVRGRVSEVGRAEIVVEVTEHLAFPEPGRIVIAVQALAKGDRSELAVEMLTETGATMIIPWTASRSVVRWSGERGDRALSRWRATAREAAKQSRRLRIPTVAEPMSTREVAARIGVLDVALVLHEDADVRLSALDLPQQAAILVVIGPEGGISTEELAAFTGAGARAVSVSDGVLRTSTAGAVAVGQLLA